MLSYIIWAYKNIFVYKTIIIAINLNLDHSLNEASSNDNVFVDALTSQEPILCEVQKISEEKGT